MNLTLNLAFACVLTLTVGFNVSAAQRSISQEQRRQQDSSTQQTNASGGTAFDRATLMAEANLPDPFPLPVPRAAVPLPDEEDRTNVPVSIRLSQPPAGELTVRRVSSNDGRLYLEICAMDWHMSGTAEVKQGERELGRPQLNGSLWLSLKPKIGRLPIHITVPGSKEPVTLTAPTTLVEVRGRRIFLNGEPFLVKGAMSRGLNREDAAYIHSLGINTLRGLEALADAEQFGFMSIASLNFGDPTLKKSVQGPDAEFQQSVGKCLKWLKQYSADPIASPFSLILQLGNEMTGAGSKPPGVQPLSLARRHVSQLLAAARNTVKPLAPMLPVGYANQDFGFLAPDCMDVYMHNSFLDKDRYGYPWEDFMRWQGCLPPEGKEGDDRPFVNSEFGANRYLCQSYLEGPNNPVLERIHAWNFPCRWAEFTEHGTAGGAIYCLYDLATPRDQGCSRFGILTFDRQPKLACWEISHMWRDFEVQAREKELVLMYKRDYWARNCRLTLSVLGGHTFTGQLEDFAPRSTRSITLSDLSLTSAAGGFRWTLDFTTHSGLVNRAAGAWPPQLEERDFLERVKNRDTFPFLSELFDTEVVTAGGKPAPRTLAEMTNSDGLIPVALRKRNGVTYLLLVARENPNQSGPLREDVTIDVAFRGKVVKVDDMTGQPLSESVEASSIPAGLRLKNIKAARIPSRIGERSKTPFMLPIYRVSP